MASVPMHDPQSSSGGWDMGGVVDALRRLVGDPPNANVPEALRTKGIIYEMREEFRAEMRSQRAAILVAERRQAKRDRAIDTALAEASSERKALRDDITDLRRGQHRIRRTIVWVGRWAGKKDDNFSVGVLKVGSLGTGLAVLGTATYHFGAFLIHKCVLIAQRMH